MSLRMFAALVPPPEAVEHLDEFVEVRRPAGEFRWATAEQLHVTLAFLASVEERRLDDLAERLARAAARRTTFDTAIAGGGAFPNPARARILWAGLDLDEDGRTQLDRLATGCRAAANRAGIAVDGRRFRPHVTLARIGHPTEVSSWVRLLDGYAGPRWPADRVALVASYLGEGARGRPRYEVVEEFALGSS
ncbi:MULTISPECIES: RNA 2',3'-cyclic phosphodiesterase [unclassified Nocardioides]|uniref:RNA 2',3'-cyclic phosphodiesterase n=1 Tax=unclassified Nocardioides TaxID=2615069 RepID=UPI0009F10089|nr:MULTISPECIES: RNA 2',3'-cyclic phosphodiesterase [unclassified Nocardioides]GAW50369.1 2'-5' RNA ligase [Nocardioides sp. PD653-B2]GAW53091.1 2'-5' RNA ligase [Nocardioides sp. PD653]